MDFSRYLDRLQIQKPAPSAPGLVALHRAQVANFCFENIDPFLSRPVSLSAEDIWRKLESRRGGYCFELNSLFLAALHEFNFSVRPALARVILGRPLPGPRTHQVSVVSFGQEEWLADVGFGGSGLVEPIPFTAGFSGFQQGRRIRLREIEWGMGFEEEVNGEWRTLYAIPPEPTEPVDLVLGNHYCSTHPSSTFRQNLHCARPSEEDGFSLFNRSLHRWKNGMRKESELKSSAELRALLLEFGVEISAAEADQVFAKVAANPLRG
jgi:N-hydroxyarylamine O-acetyltransferase